MRRLRGKKACAVATITCVCAVVLAVVIFIAYAFLNDYGQCNRACSIAHCGDAAACFLAPPEGRRKGRTNQCVCDLGSNQTAVVPRKMERVNTIEYDAAVQEYCVCDEAGLCNTVPTKPAGAFLHKGRCGACSTPADYAIYVKTATNLTSYSRAAAIWAIFSSRKATGLMLEAGFSEQCAFCWVENMRNTLQHCFGTCISNHKICVDGHLSDCIQCDEDYSGIHFRKCAGMTRRRAGIQTDICRQDGEIITQ